MASNAKTIAELLNGDVTVTATDIANDAVTADKIATGAVVADGLGTGAVTATKLGAGAVTATKLGTGAVTVNKVSGNLGRRNMIINGAMKIAQRVATVTGITSGPAMTADRFGFYTNTSGGTYTLSHSDVVPSGEGFQNSLKVDCTTAGNYSTSGTGTFLRCSAFEIQDCARLAYGTSGAKKLTVSFWTRASYTGTFTALLVTHDTAQRNIIKTFTIASADTWQKVVLTYDGDTVSTFTGADTNMGVTLDIWMGGGSTWYGGSQTDGVWRARATHNSSILEGNGTGFGTSTSHDFYITGVQVEQNDTATDFEHLSAGEDLSLCQRYFVRVGANTGTDYNFNMRGLNCVSGGTFYNNEKFPTAMRAGPTVSIFNANNSRAGNPTATSTSINGMRLDSTCVATGMGYYRYCYTADAEL
jgi:hypothetical protein